MDNAQGQRGTASLPLSRFGYILEDFGIRVFLYFSEKLDARWLNSSRVRRN